MTKRKRKTGRKKKKTMRMATFGPYTTGEGYQVTHGNTKTAFNKTNMRKFKTRKQATRYKNKKN